MRWLQRWWLAVLFAGLLVALAFPRLASAYHLEAGGRALDDPGRLGDIPAGALGHLEKALAWDARNAQAYRLLARAHQARGDWPAAVVALTRYTELWPKNPLGHIELAQLYEVVEALPVAEAEAPDKPLKLESLRPGLQALREWRSGGITAEHMISRGREEQAAERYEDAVLWYQRAVKLEPFSERTWSQFGLASRQSEGNWTSFWNYVDAGHQEPKGLDKTLQIFLDASRRFPESRYIWYELGRTYIMHGEWEKAIQVFEQGVEANASPAIGSSNLYFEIGRIKQHALDPRDHPGAWQAYQLALLFDDFSLPEKQKADTHHQLAALLAGQGRWDEALVEYQQALDSYPAHYAVHISMADTLWQAGRHTQAKEVANQAISIAPEKTSAYQLLGRFYEAEGDLAGAFTMYCKVLETDPLNEEARQAIEALEATSTCP